MAGVFAACAAAVAAGLLLAAAGRKRPRQGVGCAGILLAVVGVDAALVAGAWWALTR